jgi:hypothetical protein
MSHDQVNVHVSGLPPNMTDANLRELFAEYGPIHNARIMLDGVTGVGRGFGFVLLPNAELGARALREMNRRVLPGGHVLALAVSEHDGLVAECNMVYVRNLPISMTEARLLSAYSHLCGPVVGCILGREGGAPFNTATLTFEDVVSARAALAASHGLKPFPECQIALIAKYAESFADRAKRRALHGRAAAPTGSPGNSTTIEQQHLVQFVPQFHDHSNRPFPSSSCELVLRTSTRRGFVAPSLSMAHARTSITACSPMAAMSCAARK